MLRFLLILLPCVMIAAEPVIWSGAASNGQWQDAGNWQGGVLPELGSEVQIASDSAAVTLATQVVVDRLVISGEVRLEGAGLECGTCVVPRGAVVITLPLRAATLAVGTGASLQVEQVIDAGPAELRLDIAGTADLVGIAGTALRKRGKGVVTLHAPAQITGAIVIQQGTVRLACNEALAGPGEVALAGGILHLAAENSCSRDLLVQGGGRLESSGQQIWSGSIRSDVGGGGGLIGTYLPGDWRAITRPDWRGADASAHQRRDGVIDFRNAAFHPEAERLRLGIGGNAGDWEQFGVQWDGTIRIAKPGTILMTRSDDGSRVWIDRDGDGVASDGEWGSNGWGEGQGAITRKVQEALPAGIYRIRIQFEEGNGGNSCSLLWSDADNSAGAIDGGFVVPSGHLSGPGALTVAADGEAGLTLAGSINGEGTLCTAGAITLSGTMASAQSLVVESGITTVANAGGIDGVNVIVASGARLVFGPGAHHVCAGGSGAVGVTGELTIRTMAETTCQLHLDGTGTVIKSGPGALRLLEPCAIPISVVDGTLRLADGNYLMAMSLAAPLGTRLVFPDEISGPRRIDLDIEVPDGAPGDLGCAAFAGDRHGTWFQTAPQRLAPGRHHLRFELGTTARLRGYPGGSDWTASTAAECPRSGVVVWASHPWRGPLRCSAQVTALDAGVTERPQSLLDVGETPLFATGQRWEMQVRPSPFPVDPYDATGFSLDAEVTEPDGTLRLIPGFWMLPMDLDDRGDAETAEAKGSGVFAVRFRPRVPGAHHLRLLARWGDREPLAIDLGTRMASGEPCHAWVGIDADHRFFSAGGTLVWPIGLNLRSPNDVRSRERINTAITPDRGATYYAEVLAKLAESGGTACEIWMSGWNLGLEWNAARPGYHGQGRYNQGNGARLDRVLDLAAAHGIRVNLVINNHGQGSSQSDPEWADSPYNVINGGKLEEAEQFFRDPWAIASQERLRRYLVARYADHPAVLGWKLWSEVNLTAAGNRVVAWHREASARWEALDTYGHPVTTHWAGDWNAVHRGVAALPGIDFLCIDAYHQGNALAPILADSFDRLFLPMGKPGIVTEFGGNWDGCSPQQLLAEHASAGFVGFVCGHAGSPMLWWHEWVEQGDHWQPYGALSRFLSGEDPRGADAVPKMLAIDGLWARAWMRPGRVIGYVLDLGWQQGGPAVIHRGRQVVIGDDVQVGVATLQWWDCDAGVVKSEEQIMYPGGRLVLTAPDFGGHLAFKLWRNERAEQSPVLPLAQVPHREVDSPDRVSAPATP